MSQLRPGDVLDRRYKIESLIGVGGMGEVYRARRTRLGDIVAIKIIHTHGGDTATLRRRFMENEARMCAMLHHPYIVSVLDFGLETGVGPYLVMEYLNGQSLKQQIEERGAFDVPEVCRFASQIASALDLAHSQGIVHRDLKPGNVMTHHYTAGEMAYKIIDFGIGELQDRRTRKPRWDNSSWTLATLAYASPEQLSSDMLSGRSDIYSFGVVVYELLTGRRPFAASESRSLITKHLHELPEPPTRHRSDIPRWAEVAVLKALAKDPRSRWETASDFAQALSGAAETRPAAVSVSASRLADGYDVGELIGHGRLGSDIYKGTHRATGHQVAIRVIRRSQDAHWEAARIRFMREARMTPVSHPSILRVRDYGEEKDLVYVVTDFIPGSSLREVLDRRGVFNWNHGRALLLDLIGATRALHTHGLLAFGLTPSIIRVTSGDERERLVISSAGVTELHEVLTRAGAPSARDQDSTGMTELHEVLTRAGAPSARDQDSIDGDAFYLAPELLVGDKPDGRTDIFTIGVLGYELFTGRRPFAATTMPDLVTATLSGEIGDPREYADSLPTEAALCLLRCLMHRPDKRFSDVIELESAWRTTPS